MSSLEARNLSCAYGDVHVLDDLSLAAHPGELLILLGPNGSGKSTLLRAMARLLHVRSGSVFLQEQDIWQFRPLEYARLIALAPQAERRDWLLTVEESVRLGRAPHRGWLLPFTDDDRRVVERALQSTGMFELRERPITTLSGGEWRRMILARAIAQQASGLLLDEPIAGLDLKYQVEVLELVRRLAVHHQLMVIITMHDLNYASVYGDRLAVLSEHSLIAIGRPDEVLTPELIGRAFGIPVTVSQHPVYHTRLVVPLRGATHPQSIISRTRHDS